MPGEQALQGQRLVIPLRSIQHQLSQPFTAGIGCSLFLDAQAASEGRTDRAHIQLLTFDCRGGDDVLQQRIQDVLAFAERIDAADLAQQAPLHVDAVAQQCGDGFVLPGELWPGRLLPDPVRAVHDPFREPNKPAIRLIG
ncbi:hypothetical protein D3C80_1523150 [compost metagenome]